MGHAVEKLSNYSLPHGKAVAIGMAAAAHLAVKMQLLAAAEEIRQNNLLQALGLPIKLPVNSNAASIIQVMKSDKKNSNGAITMILPESIGKVRIVKAVDEMLLLQTLEELL